MINVLHISKYAIVGVVATIIHSLIYSLLLYFSVSPQVSNASAFAISLAVSFAGHNYWTFRRKDSEYELVRTIPKFLMSSLFGYVLNVFWVALSTFLDVHPNYAIVGFVFATPLVNYLVLKIWVFRAA